MSYSKNHFMDIMFDDGGELCVVFKTFFGIFIFAIFMSGIIEVVVNASNNTGKIDNDHMMSSTLTQLQYSFGLIMFIVTIVLAGLAIHAMKNYDNYVNNTKFAYTPGSYMVVTVLTIMFIIYSLAIVIVPYQRTLCIADDTSCYKKYKGGPLDPEVIEAKAKLLASGD
jgi:uncharacterized membrane protein